MSNRLASSASPYLLQHADNPVDWWEWGLEAFDEARRRDVPVLLSVGYSACHWCHVMAHESFEDEATAAQMNADFVNVKVDREERPDVDAVYMEATQAMTGRGGWPMTVFLDHEGNPFYTGTYFPPEDRHGMPGFRSVLAAISEAWDQRRPDLAAQAQKVTDAIGQRLPAAPDLPAEQALAEAVTAIAGQYDRAHGGFGAAPKFPQQPVLELLLRVHDRPWAGSAAEMVKGSLAAMAAGGIRDHLGGGFARYSVDAVWLVPHFEKMLYDNAQLARLYLWAGVEFESEPMTEVAIDTLEYMLGDLRHASGGFFSAEDADSEGVEGKFYVWSHNEFMAVAGEDGPVAASYFGVTPGGNFEGSNILHRARSVTDVATEYGLSPGEVASSVHRAARKLLEVRSRRTRPGLDDKVVTAWNGLAIRAFAEAGAVLSEARFVDAAEAAARFVLDNMRTDDGKLHRSWAKGRTGPPAVLDDYAALATGLFSLYAVTGQTDWYREAMTLVDSLGTLFADPEGGFFTTAVDAPALVTRPRDFFDNPLPSGNSLAAEALAMASAYTGSSEYRHSADATVRAAATIIERAPAGAGHMLSVLLTLLDGSRELAVVGPEAGDVAAVAWERFRPGLALAWGTDGDESVPLMEGRGRPGSTLAYLCRGFVCDAPVSSPEELRTLLG